MVIRALCAFVAGAAAAWAALALYGRIPHRQYGETWGERWATDADDQLAHGGLPAPLYPPTVPAHLHDALCRWPFRPCVCSVRPRTRGRRSHA